jgi:hypothetical protein
MAEFMDEYVSDRDGIGQYWADKDFIGSIR